MTQIIQNIDYDEVPNSSMATGVKLYLEHGIKPGGFLTAIICNDLFGAITRADMLNIELIADWVFFFHNHAPSGSYGSEKIMNDWIEKKRNKNEN